MMSLNDKLSYLTMIYIMYIKHVFKSLIKLSENWRISDKSVYTKSIANLQNKNTYTAIRYIT